MKDLKKWKGIKWCWYSRGEVAHAFKCNLHETGAIPLCELRVLPLSMLIEDANEGKQCKKCLKALAQP